MNANYADEILALLAIAKHRSFTLAGQSLERHPSIISKRLAAMEARLGIRLVERSTRQLKLTSTGQELAKELSKAFEHINQAETKASSSSGLVQGRLKVAVPAEMGRRCIAPFIPEFLLLYPDINLTINYSNRFIDLIEEGYDAAIRIGSLNDSRLVAKKLAPNRRILCASPAYLKSKGQPEHPTQLGKHNCLQFTGFKSFPEWKLVKDKQVESIVVKGNLTSNDTESLLAATKASVGILAAGEWLFKEDLANGALQHILPNWTLNTEEGIYFVRPSIKYASAASEAFKQWISQKLID